MRSRYSAFVTGNSPYLLETWHVSTRPATLDLDPLVRWYSLVILSVKHGGPFDSRGTVEFEARYAIAAAHPPDNSAGPSRTRKTGTQRESSRFLRQNHRWFYLDGS